MFMYLGLNTKDFLFWPFHWPRSKKTKTIFFFSHLSLKTINNIYRLNNIKSVIIVQR